MMFALLFGCSSEPQTADSNDADEPMKENSSRSTELSKKQNATKKDKATYEENQEMNNDNNPRSKTKSDSVSQEKMEQLKKTLRTYIFDEYMDSSDYVYAKGINWTKNFYDNLTAKEIWTVMEEYKEKNNGKEGTLFDKANYLSVNAPIKDNWKELFLVNWKNSPYSGNDNEIVKMIDKGDVVWVYTEQISYTGEENNYPYIVLDKRTGFWHG
ncbi:hypothetical protein [Virgibacillus ihumii]|uniref:hypothetical protein n=1 Tax=Virgibacillus ihumii TaxID=2686091 RepID=UPI00157BF63B|nr:hypothetical protein [Virgibacillus ihumii]